MSISFCLFDRHEHFLLPRSRLAFPKTIQSSANDPKSVSAGTPSRILTKPRSISSARSFSLIGDHFVRLPLMSRIAQRRRIAVSMPRSASNDFAAFADIAPPFPHHSEGQRAQAPVRLWLAL